MIFTERKPPLSFLVSEGDFHIARDNAVIAAGSGKLPSGTVLGRITAPGDPNLGKLKPSPATGSDGAQIAVAILAYPVDATSADVAALIAARRCEVRAGELTFDASVNDATKKSAKAAQLASVGIIVR